MTRLGLIARADRTGLGTQSWLLHRRLHPAKTLIVNLSARSASNKDLTIYPERFPGDTTVSHGIPDDDTLAEWMEGLDAVYTIETPYNYRLYSIARQKGIWTVLQGNWELLDYLQPGPHQDHVPDVLALPSTWHLREAQERLGDRMKVMHLPVPVPDDHFSPITPPPVATNFLHVAGYPAIGDRNGTRDLMAALPHVTAQVTITMTCQHPGWLGSLSGKTPSNVTLVIDSANPEDYRNLYAGQHALVMPRRYGGLSLPVNEALACGIPTIMTAIPPNIDWLPPNWLIGAEWSDDMMTKTIIEVYRSDPKDIAAAIDRMATDEDFYGMSCLQARSVAASYSWSVLRAKYQEAITSDTCRNSHSSQSVSSG